MRAYMVVVVFGAVGCVQSQSLICSDGLVCPETQRCDLAHHACVDPDQLAACEGLPDKTPCNAAAAPEGTCDQGVCLLARCGDGVIQGLEECDGADNPLTCTGLGYYDPDGSVVCRDDCRYERNPALSGCTGYCGDGEVRLGVELCDGNEPAIACVDLGYGAGHLGCSVQCGPGIEDCKLFGWSNTPVSAPMSDVHGVAHDAVFAVSQAQAGTPGADYYNGIAWTPIPLADCTLSGSAYFRSVWAVGREEAFATVAPDALVVRLTPTGCSRLPAIPAVANDLWAASATDIFITSSAGIHRFDGTSWNLSSATARSDLWGTAANDVWAGGPNGTVMHFDGVSWSSPTALAGITQVHAVWGVSSTEAYAAGLGGVSRFNGSGWTQILTLGAIVSAGTVASGHPIVGLDYTDGSTIMSYDGSRWSILSPRGAYAGVNALWTAPTTEHVFAAVPNAPVLPTFRGSTHVDTPRPQVGNGDRVAIKSPTEVYVIDNVDEFYSEIWRWTGFQWEKETNHNGNPTDIWVDSSGTVRIIEAATEGGGGTMRVRTGPSAWSTIASGVEGTRLWGASGTDYWAFAGSSLDTLRHYVNGALVTCTGCPAAQQLNALGGTSTSNVFFVGANGKIYRYDGTMVAETPSGTTKSLLTVGASPDGQHVWVGGVGGTLLHWNGATWEPVAAPNVATITAVWGTSPSDLFVGQFGFLYHFDGTYWSPVAAEVSGAVAEIESYGDSIYYVDRGGVPSWLHSIVRTRPW